MQSAAAQFLGYRVRVRTLEFPCGSIELLGPADFERLVDHTHVAERFEEDEYLPCWAEFWPACLLPTRRIPSRRQRTAHGIRTIMPMLRTQARRVRQGRSLRAASVRR